MLFSLVILKFKLFKYQAEILESGGKRIIIVAGRQVGKTYMLAIYALWWAFTKPDQCVLIVAPTLRQSKIMYNRVRTFGSLVPWIRRSRIKDTMTETIFDNNSEIHCLPAGRTGDNIRGYPANLVIFDEAAFIPDPVITAIRPSMSAVDGDMILSGTPFGMNGKFYEFYAGIVGKFKRYKWRKFKIPSILSPLISQEFLDEEREQMTDAEWRMEYNAEFISDTDEFFPKSLLKKAMRDYQYYIVTDEDLARIEILEDEKLKRRMMLIGPGDRVIGLDVARYGLDETAAVVLERLKDKTMSTVRRKTKLYKVIWAGTRGRTSIPEAADWGRELMDIFDAKAISVDATGLGGGVFDLLEPEFGDKVNGVNFSSPVRRALYETLKIALERENLIINADDRKMLRQFGGFKLKKTDSATGEMQIKKSTTGHDDLVDGLALALWTYEEGRRLQPLDPRLADMDSIADAEDDFDDFYPTSELGEEMKQIRREREKIMKEEREKRAEEHGKDDDDDDDEEEEQEYLTPTERKKRAKKKLQDEAELWGI